MKWEVRQEGWQADHSLPLHAESLLAPGEPEVKSHKDPQQGDSSHLKQSQVVLQVGLVTIFQPSKRGNQLLVLSFVSLQNFICFTSTSDIVQV